TGGELEQHRASFRHLRRSARAAQMLCWCPPTPARPAHLAGRASSDEVALPMRAPRGALRGTAPLLGSALPPACRPQLLAAALGRSTARARPAASCPGPPPAIAHTRAPDRPPDAAWR